MDKPEWISASVPDFMIDMVLSALWHSLITALPTKVKRKVLVMLIELIWPEVKDGGP